MTLQNGTDIATVVLAIVAVIGVIFWFITVLRSNPNRLQAGMVLVIP